jgi:hypothetical protein
VWSLGSKAPKSFGLVLLAAEVISFDPFVIGAVHGRLLPFLAQKEVLHNQGG